MPKCPQCKRDWEGEAHLCARVLGDDFIPEADRLRMLQRLEPDQWGAWFDGGERTS